MALLSNRSLATIKDLLGHHRNLHPHLTALQEGSETALDIDIVLEELEYYVAKKRNILDPSALVELQDAIQRLRNS